MMRTLVLLLATGLVLTACESTSVNGPPESGKAPLDRSFVVLDATALAGTPVERLVPPLAALHGLQVERVVSTGPRQGFIATMPEATTLKMLEDPRVRSVEQVREEPREAAPETTSTTPLTVSISEPHPGATLSGTVVLRAGVSDGRSTYVEFFLDGTGSRIASCNSPCTSSWDTRSTPNGVHSLTARAWGDSGYLTSAAVSVTVDQDVVAPTVTLLSPSSGVTVGETMTFQGSATDDKGITVVRLFVNGSFYDVLSFGGGTFDKAVSTRNLGNGTHTMAVEARDTSDNISFSQSITVTVDRDVTPPSVVLTSPASAVTVPGGPLALAADATDDRGLARVVFVLDGYSIGEDTTPPFTGEWNTSTLLDGDYTLSAKAFDLVGNVATSAPVTLTVKQPHGATFDPTLGAPACHTLNAVCDSMKLLMGRHTAEVHAPNTIDGCADGQGPEAYAERVQRVIVSRLGGEFLAENRRARISVTVPAPSYNLDHLDLFYTSDATHPSWTYLTTLRPNPYGTQVLSAEYVLPEGPLQAVRAQFRVSHVSTLSCSAGAYDDHDDLVFAVGPPTDTFPPTVTLTAPYSGFLYGGQVPVTATAEDDLAVTRVEFFADGVLFATDTSAPYEGSWNSATVTDGAHSLTAKAYDTAGHVTTSAARGVTTDNTAPQATLVSHTPGMLLRGNVVLEATYSDAQGVSSFDFYADETRLATYPTSTPTAKTWYSWQSEDGPRTLTVRARDSAGNLGISTGVAVIIDNTPPPSEITAPAYGAKLRGTVDVNVTASDLNGVAKVELYAGETLVGTDATAPFSVSWNTTTVADGSVNLKTRAYDLAGNAATSWSGHAVSVDNTAPTVAITSPANGASVFLSTTLQASAADNVGVTQVVFYDGTKVLGTDTTAPYSYSWNLLSVTKGWHTLTAKGYDAVGNVTTSVPITVKVN